MLSLLQVLDRTTDYFGQRGVPSPRLQAELLIAHALGCRRLDLFLRFDQPMTEDLLERLRPFVRRRAAREPLQFILGTTPFHELKLKTDRRALIPRPETEELVEHVLKRAPAATRVLDLGTGTGALALALAKALPGAAVTAVDQSPEALALARENAVANALAERVRFVQSDWFSHVEGLFDLIVSNPPYLTREEWESAEPEVREHEPYAALVADNGGLADLEHIVRAARAHLSPGGMLALETGIAHRATLAQLADTCGYARSEGLPDLSGRDRFFMAWQPAAESADE